MFLTVGDFSDDEIDWVLERADALSTGAHPDGGAAPGLLGLLFLEASLRTRVGFAAAASRLGWRFVDIAALRSGPTSMAESWEDTLRTVTGYCDLVVARPGHALAAGADPRIACPVINGGDVGLQAQHPTQALIDLFAVQQLRGPVAGLKVALVGDIGMRAARSLLTLLHRRLPASIAAVTDPAFLPAGHERCWPELVIASCLDDVVDADVVYVVGMPHDSIPLADRRRLVVTPRFVESLSDDAVVLAPMPILDEIEPAARPNHRVQFDRQSDLATFVRMAVIELTQTNRSD